MDMKKIMTIRNILIGLTFLLIIFFFLTTIKISVNTNGLASDMKDGGDLLGMLGGTLESIDGTGVLLSGWGIMTGHYTMSGTYGKIFDELLKADNTAEAMPMFCVLIVLPIIVLVILILAKKIAQKKACIITTVCSIIDLLIWICVPLYLSLGLNNMEGGSFLKLELTIVYWFTIIALVAEVVVSALILNNKISLDKEIKIFTKQIYKNKAIENEKPSLDDLDSSKDESEEKKDDLKISAEGSSRTPRYCSNCGNELKGNSNFCSQCGKKIG